jgi:hypothetical protein
MWWPSLPHNRFSSSGVGMNARALENAAAWRPLPWPALWCRHVANPSKNERNRTQVNTYLLECAQANSDPAYEPTGGWMPSTSEAHATAADAITALDNARAANADLEFRITVVPARYRTESTGKAIIGGDVALTFNV